MSKPSGGFATEARTEAEALSAIEVADESVPPIQRPSCDTHEDASRLPLPVARLQSHGAMGVGGNHPPYTKVETS